MKNNKKKLRLTCFASRSNTPQDTLRLGKIKCKAGQMQPMNCNVYCSILQTCFKVHSKRRKKKKTPVDISTKTAYSRLCSIMIAFSNIVKLSSSSCNILRKKALLLSHRRSLPAFWGKAIFVFLFFLLSYCL